VDFVRGMFGGGRRRYALGALFHVPRTAESCLGCRLIWANTTPPPLPRESRQEAQWHDRSDLIRRLFAVAISVGAATTLYRMRWVLEGRPPCLAEYQQLLILVAAMTATVLSWDGYLWSVKQRPLRNFWRFTIDILLVFIYLLLLMTSQLLTWWLFIHALIYLLYALWDWLSVMDWTAAFYPPKTPSRKITIRGVYVEGLRDGANESRGPIITIAWGLYFWALCGLNYLIVPWFNGLGLREYIVISTVLVVLGLYEYRQDKITRYSMFKRTAWIAVLLLADAAYLAWLPSDPTLWEWVGPYIGSAFCGQ